MSTIITTNVVPGATITTNNDTTTGTVASNVTVGLTGPKGDTGATGATGAAAILTDATTAAKGVIKLAGDLTGTADLPNIKNVTKVFNVKDYGAVGDGTNDQTAINNALAAAAVAGGGTVYLPAGTYGITNFIGSSTYGAGFERISIRGAGRGLTTIKNLSNTVAISFGSGNASLGVFGKHYLVADLTLDMNNLTAASNGGLAFNNCQYVDLVRLQVINKVSGAHAMLFFGSSTGATSAMLGKHLNVYDCIWGNDSGTSTSSWENITLAQAENVKFFGGLGQNTAKGQAILLNYGSHDVGIFGMQFINCRGFWSNGFGKTLVSGCNFFNATSFNNASNVVHQNCTFESTNSSTPSGISFAGYEQASGESFWDAEPAGTAVQCRNNKIINCHFKFCNNTAINSSTFLKNDAITRLVSSYDLEIIGCTIEKSNAMGLDVVASNFLRIENTTSFNNGQSLLGYNYAFGGKTVIFRGNRSFDDQTTATATQDFFIDHQYPTLITTQEILIEDNQFSIGSFRYYTGSFSTTKPAGVSVKGKNNWSYNPDIQKDYGSTGGTLNFSRTQGKIITVTATSNIIATVANGQFGNDEMTWHITQDATGSRTLTLPASVIAANGGLILSTSANSVDTITWQWDGVFWREKARALATAIVTTPADATTTSKGVIQLVGDLAGTATLPTVPGLTAKAATTYVDSQDALKVAKAGDTMTGALTPATTGGTSLGSSALYWANVFANRYNLNSTAYLDGATAGQVTLTGNLLQNSSTTGTMGITGLASGHSATLQYGDTSHYIRTTFGVNPVTFQTYGGLSVQNNAGTVALLGSGIGSGVGYDSNFYGNIYANTGVIVPITTPGVATLTPSTTGGTLAAATYFYKIVALDNLVTPGTTAAGAESSVTTTGTTSSIGLTWTAVDGAVSYRIYRGTSAGAQSLYYTSNTNSFTEVGAAGTGGGAPTLTTAGLMRVQSNGITSIRGGVSSNAGLQIGDATNGGFFKLGDATLKKTPGNFFSFNGDGVQGINNLTIGKDSPDVNIPVWIKSTEAAGNQVVKIMGATNQTGDLTQWRDPADAATLANITSTGDLQIATAGTTASSAVTVGGTQTLTNKTVDTATANGNTIKVRGMTLNSSADNTGTINFISSSGSQTLVNLSTTQTLTNKVLTSATNTFAEVTSTASSATPTPTGGSRENELTITAGTVGMTVAAPTGTPVNGNRLMMAFFTAAAQTLAFNAIFAPVGVTLPTTTAAGKWTYIQAVYNTTAVKWHVLEVNQEV